MSNFSNNQILLPQIKKLTKYDALYPRNMSDNMNCDIYADRIMKSFVLLLLKSSSKNFTHKEKHF